MTSDASTDLDDVASTWNVGVERERRIAVQIDYAIVQHFSQYLYSSPNKAVEELISNAYDAFATKVFTYLPGSQTRECVIVWDNGQSMSEDELHKLWWIARSPKSDLEHDRVVKQGQNSRALIGKFGIGKLASYAIGHRITHLTRRGSEFLMVSVDYRRVPKLVEGETQKPMEAPVLELTEDEAQLWARGLFLQSSPSAFQCWDEQSWTLAVIDQLKPNALLTEGRLSWIVSRGMPLRPDFEVFINDRKISSYLAKSSKAEWDFGETLVLDYLKSEWKKASENGQVQGIPEYGHQLNDLDGRAVPAVSFPNLGVVRIRVNLFEGSLRKDNEDEAGRSYGFFVLVRERLLNPDDPKLMLHDPAFGVFYRSHFVIWADALDDILLADRERVLLASDAAKELEILQRSLYLAARNYLDHLDTSEDGENQSGSLLPVASNEFFREPLRALLLKHGNLAATPISIARPEVERRPLGAFEPLSTIAEDGALLVNVTHPFAELVDQVLKQPKKAAIVRQAADVFGLLAISERLLEGHLLDAGMSIPEAEKIMKWRDGLFRAIAARANIVPFDALERTLIESSYKGNKPFERAIAEIFRRIGFTAEVDGRSDKKDVLVLAPIGREHFLFTVEAKGSKSSVANDQAEVSGAAGHRDDAKAEFAVIVAREFAGFKRGGDDDAALLRECRSTERVSIATVDVLVRLIRAIDKFGYPLSVVKETLSVIESPADKLKRIEKLESPTRSFDYVNVLNEIWRRQIAEAKGDEVPFRSVWQAKDDRWGVEFSEFEVRLQALATLSESLIALDTSEKTVQLLQSPQMIVDAITLGLSASEDGD